MLVSHGVEWFLIDVQLTAMLTDWAYIWVSKENVFYTYRFVIFEKGIQRRQLRELDITVKSTPVCPTSIELLICEEIQNVREHQEPYKRIKH